MRYFATCRIIALALLLAISHTALVQHETAHSDTELGQCELCFSHAQSPTATIQSDQFAAVDSGKFTYSGAALRTLVFRVAVHPYHSRAPPFIA